MIITSPSYCNLTLITLYPSSRLLYGLFGMLIFLIKRINQRGSDDLPSRSKPNAEKNTNIKTTRGNEYSVFIDKYGVLCYYCKGNFCVKLAVC